MKHAQKVWLFAAIIVIGLAAVSCGNEDTATAPAITTDSLSGGTVGTAYSQTLAATGDTPITCSIDSGTLPDGLSLSGNTISGTPSAFVVFSLHHSFLCP